MTDVIEGQVRGPAVWPKLILLVAGCMALAACNGTVGINYPPVADPRLAVEEQGVVRLKDVGAQARLSFEDRQRVTRLVMDLSQRGREGLRVALVCNGSREREGDLVETLAGLGIGRRSIHIYNQRSPASHPGCVEVAAWRTVPKQPVCPTLFNESNLFPEQSDPGLGCANDVNLAESVVRPRDVLGRSANRPADGERAAVPVRRYREFRVPALPNGAASQFLDQPATP